MEKDVCCNSPTPTPLLKISLQAPSLFLGLGGWVQFKVLVLTYEALNGLGPEHLKDLQLPAAMTFDIFWSLHMCPPF